jgi:acetylornithine deacetylase/succinyl-diaminopimelate desuccinylase-like protein
MLATLVPEDAWPQLQKEAVAFLDALVHVRSINPSSANATYPTVFESAAAEVIRAKLAQDDIPSEILAKDPEQKRSNIIAKLAGDGSAKPVLLLGHLDVVGIGKGWTHDPFAAEVVDGRMYGRGTADMKSIVVLHVMTLLAIKRYKIKLKRDVILAGVADEEGGSNFGMRWLIAEHWDKIAAEFALNEGFTGGPHLGRDGKTVIWAGLEAIEKRIMEAAIVATGHGGHASSERPDNAIYRLAVALRALQAHPRPLVLNPVSAAFARSIKILFGQDLLSDPRPGIRAMFHDIVVPTLLKGGTDAVVLPEQACATLICRLLPTTDTGEFQQWLENVVAAPGVSVEYPLCVPDAAVAPASPDTPLVTAYAGAVRRQFGDVPVLLTQGTGTDDNFYLRQKGVQAYGIHPLVDAKAENMHGPDESIPVEAFKQGLRMIMETVLELAT